MAARRIGMRGKYRQYGRTNETRFRHSNVMKAGYRIAFNFTGYKITLGEEVIASFREQQYVHKDWRRQRDDEEMYLERAVGIAEDHMKKREAEATCVNNDN